MRRVEISAWMVSVGDTVNGHQRNPFNIVEDRHSTFTFNTQPCENHIDLSGKKPVSIKIGTLNEELETAMSELLWSITYKMMPKRNRAVVWATTNTDIG